MSDDPLRATERAKIRRVAGEATSTTHEGGELNVVPFLDILVNVLLFVIATMPVLFTASIATSPPESGPGTRPKHEAALGLSVLLTDDGIGIKAAGGNVAPGCDGIGPGLALPKEKGSYPWAKLRACVARVKEANDAAPDARSVVVMADPSIEYQTVIDAIDAIRTTDDGQPLVDDVRFGVAR